jgi:hypothetical protein
MVTLGQKPDVQTICDVHEVPPSYTMYNNKLQCYQELIHQSLTFTLSPSLIKALQLHTPTQHPTPLSSPASLLQPQTPS